MEMKDWYQKRNDRINRIENIRLDYLTDKPIAVIIGKNNINRYSNQLMTLISLNILSKWNSRITTELNGSIECCLPNYPNTKLKQVIEAVIYENDPFGKFKFSELLDTSEFEYILIIGDDNKNYPTNSIWIDSYNWVFGISNSSLHYCKPKIESKNPIGPVFAACSGIALLFKNYNDNSTPRLFEKWYTLFDYKSSNSVDVLQNPEIPYDINIGNTYQIGCGAIGSSLDYLLSLTNLRGKIFLIDYDKINIENICSSLIFNYNDAKEEHKKTEACKKSIMKNQLLEVVVYDGDYSSFIKSIDYFHDQYPETILCLANEKNVWATIQNNLPPVVYHATTSPNWVVNFGRHIPQKEWCIVCRFGIENYDYVPKCSTGIINGTNEKGETHLGTLPFLAPTAATLILSELIKKNIYPNYPLSPENFIQFSMNFAKMNEFILIKKNKKESCPVCRSQSLTDYPAHFKKKFTNMI
jgi:hypothetical protein